MLLGPHQTNTEQEPTATPSSLKEKIIAATVVLAILLAPLGA